MTDECFKPGDVDELTLLRRVLEASPSFLHVLRGPDFVFEYANEAYYRLVGRRDLIGRAAFEAMPEAAGEYPQRITQVMVTRRPFHGNEIPVMLARVPGAPLEKRWIDLVYLPLIDADGTCQRVLGHGTDVTEIVQTRRLAEQAERLSRERLAGALLAGRMVAWEWNVQTDALTGTGAWLELFRSASEIFTTGEAALQHVHPGDRAARIAMVRASLTGLAHWHQEYRTVRADGSVLWLEERASLSRHPDTGEQIVVGLAWDITQGKQSQAAMELADVRKNDFLATLSHELRNPLAPIRSGLQIIKLLANGDERLDKTRQVMERQMAHLVRLIDDLMEVSRISRGKVTLRQERLPLNSVLATAVESVWPAIEAKTVRLVQVTSETLAVDGDKDRLTQVFSNLLSNAVKFSPAQSTITLTLRQENHEAVVMVEDQGQGIEAHMLETVFDLFAQGPSHPMSGGLGIGLALVRQLVELHGGRVSVQSKGTTRAALSPFGCLVSIWRRSRSHRGTRARWIESPASN
jgi:signal transduction histidine kinase